MRVSRVSYKQEDKSFFSSLKVSFRWFLKCGALLYILYTTQILIRDKFWCSFYLYRFQTIPRMLSKCKHLPENNSIAPNITSTGKFPFKKTLWGQPLKKEQIALFFTSTIYIYSKSLHMGRAAKSIGTNMFLYQYLDHLPSNWKSFFMCHKPFIFLSNKLCKPEITYFNLQSEDKQFM